MNRKLYEESQQYKERTCDQRQQIDNFHILFEENKQENERAIAVLRKELNEASLEKRRLQMAIDATHQDAMREMSALRVQLDEAREREARAILELQQERSKNELSEKKCKLVEKDVALLREAGELERRELEAARKHSIQEVEVCMLFIYAKNKTI